MADSPEVCSEQVYFRIKCYERDPRCLEWTGGGLRRVPRMHVQLPAHDQYLWQTYARFRSLGPIIPLEMPGGVMVWAATSHAAVREVLQGDDRLFAKHLTNWKAFRDGKIPEDTAAATLETSGPVRAPSRQSPILQTQLAQWQV